MELLFRIRCLHSFYSDGVLADFQWMPDRATAQLMSRFQLISRQQHGVFGVLRTGQSPGFIEYLRNQSSAEVLRFLLVGDRSRFLFITDLPLNWVGTLMLSTQAVQKNAAGDREMIPALESGSRGGGVVAEVAIHLEDLLTPPAENTYVMAFSARSVGWHYYVVNRGQMVFNQPAIVSGQGQTMVGPETCVLPNGEPALSYSSGTVNYPLQQVPSLRFDLVDRWALPSGEECAERCYVKGLPTPGQHNMTRLGEHDSRLVCAMYVYV